jgi:hypothetical protein
MTTSSRATSRLLLLIGFGVALVQTFPAFGQVAQPKSVGGNAPDGGQSALQAVSETPARKSGSANRSSEQRARPTNQQSESGSVGSPSGLWRGTRRYLNWSDLPLLVTVNQSIGYNDNILGAPNDRAALSGSTRGDWFSTTVFGASSKLDMGRQKLFFDGSYGFTKYRVNPLADTNQYALKSGVDWVLTTSCSGSFSASATKRQQPLQDQVTPGINTQRIDALAGNAKCRLYGNLSLIFEGGASSTRNSAARTPPITTMILSSASDSNMPFPMSMRCASRLR